MPLYCLGLWEAVIMAPPSSEALATAKYSMSVETLPMSTTLAPRDVAPSINAVLRSVDVSRMSCPMAIFFAFR